MEKKAYTEITEDAEFAEKRKAGRVELVGEVLESLTPEGVRYRGMRHGDGIGGGGTKGRGTGVTDIGRGRKGR